MACYVLVRDHDSYEDYGIIGSFKTVIDIIKLNDPDNDFDYEFDKDDRMLSFESWMIEIKDYTTSKSDIKINGEQDLFDRWMEYLTEKMELHTIDEVASMWDDKV